MGVVNQQRKRCDRQAHEEVSRRETVMRLMERSIRPPPAACI